MIERLLGDSEIFRAVAGFLSWSWPYLLAAVHLTVATATSIHVVMFKRDVRSAVAWCGLVWLSPFVGAGLYAVFGINRIHRRATRLRTKGSTPDELFPEGALIPMSRRQEAPGDPAAERGPGSGLDGLRHFIGNVSGRELTEGNAVTPLECGDEAYPAMLEAIESAERTVAMGTFIFDRGEAGERFVEALAAAVRRGVEVRVLIDGVGVRYSRPRITRSLDRCDVPNALFLESISPVHNPYMNMRNHRKILVVDGRVGFTGGLNIRDGCVLENDPEHPVRDLHFRFEGPVVRHMMDDFALDWDFTTNERLEGGAWFPELEAAGPVQARGIPDGPDEDFEAILWCYLGAMAAAKDRIRIVTPYFVPDQVLIASLNMAALRGVEVHIVIPEEGNLRFVQWACTAQLWQVLINGCRVFLSPPPFDHSKLMVVDDEWAFVGSANWDARSLRLNFEFNVECYDRGLAERIDGLIDETIAKGRETTLDELAARSWPVKLRDGVARLMAPYL